MDGAHNAAAVFELVQATAPAVVSLVEVDEYWEGAPGLSELARRLGYFWVFIPAFEYGHESHESPAGGFGNALLVRLPVLAVHQRQLTWPTTLHDGTESSERRSVVLARLGTGAGPLWVGSTHLPRGDADARTAALRRLSRVAGKLDGHWLICGDYNTPASSWLDRTGRFTALPRSAQPTYPVGQPTEPIDYCITSPELSATAEVLPTTGSDHYPILVSCIVPAAA
jgi:endonuclease/exonuclease/phosphatase family metal-dependent hydrolase